MNKRCKKCVWLERINAQTAYCMFKRCIYGNSREKDKRTDTLRKERTMVDNVKKIWYNKINK